MTATSGKLSHKQDLLIASLLTEPTIALAAKQAGISEATALRWLKLPDVAAAYRDARREVATHALATVMTATTAAVVTLRACLALTLPPSIRLRAAVAILDTASRAIETEDLVARVEQLEARLKEQVESSWNGGIRAV
jgi:hypothetical protein